MRPIKIGQIGIGHNHAEGVMQCLRKFPERFDVVGVSENDDAWLIKRGGLNCYRGLSWLTEEELLKKCDAVIVETEVPNLTKTAIRCIRAGKHVHMDKPASGTYKEFKNMLALAKRRNLLVQMGYMYRNNPAVKKLISMIQDGVLGDIYTIHAEMSTEHSDEYREWLSRFPGGIQYILGSHLVDLVVSILGEPKRITSFLNHSMKNGIDAEDNCLSVYEYEHALARISVSSVEVNGWARRQFVVSGSKGTVSIMPMERPTVMRVSLSPTPSPYEVFEETIDIGENAMDARYDEMMCAFHTRIMDGQVNPCDYAHDALVHKVLLKTIKAGQVKTSGKEKNV